MSMYVCMYDIIVDGPLGWFQFLDIMNLSAETMNLYIL